MRLTNRLLVLAIGLSLAGCASQEVRERRQEARDNAQKAATAARPEGLYRVAAGDSIKIEYTYNEELNRVVVVRPDGYISLPLLDDVRVAGQTVDGVREALVARYTGILKSPVLTVSLENAGSFKVYVGGEVTTPGVFQLASGVTALRAIAMAGGARPTAGLSSVMIIRDHAEAKPEYLMVDLRAGINALDSRQDILLSPKDLVFVPKSRIASVDQFVDQYMNQLIPFQKSLGVSYIVGAPIY